MRVLFLTESLSTSMGGLATGTLNLALGLANHFANDEHKIIAHENNDSKIIIYTHHGREFTTSIANIFR